MASQWQNFQRNLGDWQGSFTTLDREGHALDTTPSRLTLSSGEEGRVVHFRLRRFGDAEAGSPPTRDIAQEYRSLGRQVVFFDNGSFSKGSLQIAPGTRFGAEYGFISGDRRHRLVQLFGEDGAFSSLVLIREFRAGTAASEGPPLTPCQLSGRWQGEAATIEADWPEPTLADAAIQVDQVDGDGLRIETRLAAEQSVVLARREEAGPADGADGSGLPAPCYAVAGPTGTGELPGRMVLLPDGGLSLVPSRVHHRQGFSVEAGWLQSPTCWQRLIRRYGQRGEWLSSTLVIAHRP
jgi:hypothetical protein